MALTDAQSGGTVYALAAAYPVTLAGTVSKGDILGYSAGWKRALATTGAVIAPRVVALADGVSGGVIKVCPVVLIGGRFSACTVGALVYTAEGAAAGQYTETKPVTSGDINAPVGHAVAADMILVSCAGNLDSVA